MTDTISPDEFRKASGLWATGVSIVTTVDNAQKPYGLTMNSVTSLSLNPPLYLVNVDKGSDTLAPMLESKAFCINVLAAGQEDLSNRFAKKGDDKFADVDFDIGRTGAPRLNGSLMTIECRVTDVHEGGDHHIVVGAVEDITTNLGEGEPEPLLYFSGRYAAVSR